MIDWLNIEIPFPHEPIKQGHRMIINHDGEITSDFVLLRTVQRTFDDEGSYTSSIAIQSGDSPYTMQINPNVKDGYVTGLMVKGNPLKYVQGHNIFGISCIRSIVAAVLLDALPKLDFNDIQVFQIFKLIEDYQFKVTKIDITYMFNLGTNSDVNNYLYMLPHTLNCRGNRFDFVKNTAYVGRHSGLWALKMYNKYVELTSRSKKHRLPSFLPKELLDFVSGQLRVELVLHKQILDRLDLTDPRLLQAKLDDLFKDFMGRITMRNQHIKENDYIELAPAYQATISKWRQGYHLKSLLPHNTYYRHRRKLLDLGIDISKPPIKADQRLTYIKPLKLLEPTQVTSIPPQFMKYQARELFA